MFSDILREATKKNFNVTKLIKVCLAECKLGYLITTNNHYYCLLQRV